MTSSAHAMSRSPNWNGGLEVGSFLLAGYNAPDPSEQGERKASKRHVRIECHDRLMILIL